MGKSNEDKSRRNSVENEQMIDGHSHSRNNSNESKLTCPDSELSIAHIAMLPPMLPMNATQSVSGSQSLSATASMDEEEINLFDQFDVYTQCLPNKLDLSDINFLFKHHKNVSDSVLHNAQERI